MLQQHNKSVQVNLCDSKKPFTMTTELDESCGKQASSVERALTRKTGLADVKRSSWLDADGLGECWSSSADVVDAGMSAGEERNRQGASDMLPLLPYNTWADLLSECSWLC